MSRSFLREVVAHVADASRDPRYAEGVPSDRARPPPSLRRAIERERSGGALLVEYKRASPGSPVALPPPRNVAEFLRATDVAGVAGYSCLATAYGFEGAPSRVAELAAGTARPVLFKEFVLNAGQVEVAARTGAAAVLLIARLEDRKALASSLADLSHTVHAVGLEVMLELHDTAELSRVDGVEADVFGVNTRDLDTLSFERPRAYRTLERAAELGLRPLVGLSGVEGPAEAQAFWAHGCDGILVGSAVARADAPARWLSSLRRPAGGPA